MADEINFLPSRDPKPAGPGTPNAELLIEARENSQRDNQAWGAMYRVMEDDQAFLAGRQWDTQDVIDRNTAGHVTLTINDLPQYLDQVVGDMRMNPTQIRVRAADWGAASTKFVSNSGRKYESSDVRAGLIRQIEYKSNASLHYNLAGQAAAETGLGWLRLYTEYTDENTFAQDICIERIKNRWSVLIDCMAQQPDFSDADHCFVGSWMKLEEFNKKYPGEAPTPIGANYQGWWSREGYVRVAEYYWREEYKEGLLQLDNGTLVRESDKAMWKMAMELPERIVQSREVTRKRVKWCKMTYSRVISKIRTLPGQLIPVVPVIGKRFEGQEDDFFYGLVRFAKEPKRMENYWLSSATERISLMPTAPWLVTAANVKGYTDTWAGANSGTAAYLPFNVDPDNPNFVPQRQTPPSIPAGEMQMMLAFGEKVKSTVGFHDAGVGKARNEQSGVAIEKLQRESDVGAFVFNDNLRVSISYIGKVLNSWLPSIYDSERFITVRHENGEVDTIEINKVDDTGQIINDMTEGMFDIHVETGPAYTTVRAQAADMTMELVKVLAQIGEGDKAAAIVDIAVAEMDIPGNERIAARLRKMVPPALIDPTELTEEERTAPPPQPTPDQIAANAMAEAKMAEAEAAKLTALAKSDTADATRARARADIAQAEADMVATLVGSPEAAETADMELAEEKRTQAGAGAKPAGGGLDEAAVKEIVMNSLAEIIASMQNTGGPDNGRGTGTAAGAQPGTPAAAPAGGPVA
jgi:hypothetical protein